MATISITREISAMHVLDDEPKCGRFHGHNYLFEIEVSGDLKEDGMVVNFDYIKDIIDVFDHKLIVPSSHVEEFHDENLVRVTLNHRVYEVKRSDICIIESNASTAEHIAYEVWGAIIAIENVESARVKLWETRNSYVIVQD